MPIYVFSCVDCGAKTEVIQKFDDPAPVCGCGHVMERDISKTNFKLIGTGWYKDGYSPKVPPVPEMKPIREGYNAPRNQPQE